jgi:hypothetical protein
MTSLSAAAQAGAQVAVCETDSRRSFRALDRDGNGSLSFEEFLGDGQDLPAGKDDTTTAATTTAGSATTTASATATAAGDGSSGMDTPDFMSELNSNLMQMQEMFAALDAAIAGINAYMTDPNAGSPPDDFFNDTPRTA